MSYVFIYTSDVERFFFLSLCLSFSSDKMLPVFYELICGVCVCLCARLRICVCLYERWGDIPKKLMLMGSLKPWFTKQTIFMTFVSTPNVQITWHRHPKVTHDNISATRSSSWMADSPPKSEMYVWVVSVIDAALTSERWWWRRKRTVLSRILYNADTTDLVLSDLITHVSWWVSWWSLIHSYTKIHRLSRRVSLVRK